MPDPDVDAAPDGPPESPSTDAPAADAPAGLRDGALAGLLGYRLAQASIATSAVFEASIGEPMSLRPVDFSILMLLQANDGCTPKTLSSALAVSPPHLTILLDRLQARRLVSRERSEIDRRAQCVRLTDEGRALAARAAATAATMERPLLHRLSSAERAMLFELLGKVRGRRPEPGPD